MDAEKKEVQKITYFKVPLNVMGNIRAYINNSRSDLRVAELSQLLGEVFSLQPITEIVPQAQPKAAELKPAEVKKAK